MTSFIASVLVFSGQLYSLLQFLVFNLFALPPEQNLREAR